MKIVEGTDDLGNIAVEGNQAPWFVFDMERQDWSAGPFPSRGQAERAASEPFETRLRRWKREDLALQLKVAAIMLVYGAAAFAIGWFGRGWQ